MMQMHRSFIKLTRFGYRALRPILFKFESERIHNVLLEAGETFGGVPFMRRLFASLYRVNNPSLSQTLQGITFENPVGLAAGFDYKAQLMHFLPSLGFGFGTVGTITNSAYEGNPPPRLGRLVKSKSLLVNKGFKNNGIDSVLAKLSGQTFAYPVGLSLGKTNGPRKDSQEASPRDAAAMTQAEAVQDVVAAFQKAEASSVPFAYYELNISCPNLYGNVSFYPPENLRGLLTAVTTLKLHRPLFVKMPISETDEAVKAMLRVILSFPVQGIVFGNLQKDRSTPALIPAEVAKWPRGNFSGMSTQVRSDELVRLAYREIGKKLTIVGCGGIMSAEDAYRKIRLGASLVQLITGMIFEGPQLVAEVNLELIKLLRRDGFGNISEAVGSLARIDADDTQINAD